MADVIKNLEEVYKKWEEKSKRGFYQRYKNTNNEKSHIQNSRNDSQNINSGFDWFTLPNYERKTVPSWERRTKFKMEHSLPNSNGIAQFKMFPVVLPQSKERPIMGSCCNDCFPFSLGSTSASYSSPLGVRNVLLLPYENRNALLPRSLHQTLFLLSRNSKFKYPDISSQVLSSENVKSVVLKVCDAWKDKKNNDQDAQLSYEAKQWKLIRRILHSMKIRVSSLFLRFTGWFLFLLLRKTFKTINVRKSQIETLSSITKKEVPIIYLPVSRSFVDPVLISFILHMYNLQCPLIALEESSQDPILSYLLRCLGGYQVKNKQFLKGRIKYVNKAVLKTFVMESLKAGHCMEFFLEECRSRSGKTSWPNFDYILILMEAVVNGCVDDVYLTPVTLSYEKIADGNFIAEQLGHRKEVDLSSTLVSVWRLLHSNFGSVRVDFCQPFSLKEVLSSLKYDNIVSAISTLETPPNSPEFKFQNSESLYSSESPSGMLNPILRDLGRHIVYDSTGATALMCTQLVAFLFLTKQRKGATEQQLIYNFNWLRRELNRRKKDVGFTGDSTHVAKYALNLLNKELIFKDVIDMDWSSSDMENNNTKITIYKPVTKLPYVLELQYYANAVIPVFLYDSVVVNALFSLMGNGIEMLQGCDSKVVVSREDLIEKSLELIDILQFEFVFCPPCQDKTQNINEVIENLVAKECLEVTGVVKVMCGRVQHSCMKKSEYDFDSDFSDADEDHGGRIQQIKVDLSEETISYLQFMQSILSPYIECYWLAASTLLKLVHEEKDEEEFLCEMQKTAQDRLHRGLLAYEESFASDTLHNAVKLFEFLKIIESYNIDAVKIIYLQDYYNCDDKIDDVILRIEQFRK